MSRKEPHLEVIRMLTTIKIANEAEIERLEKLPGTKKMVSKAKKQVEKLEKGIERLRKDKSKRIVQQKMF